MKQLLRSQAAGWFCMTIGGLYMLTQYVMAVPFNMLASLVFLFGLIIVMNQSDFFTLSDSSIKVRHEIRTQHAKKAHHVHKKHGAHTVEDVYTLRHVLGLLAVILCILIPAQYWITMLFILLVFGWQIHASINRNPRESFWVQLFYFVVILVWVIQGTNSILASFNEIPAEAGFRLLLSMATLLLVLGSVIPLILERRDAVRMWVRNQFILLTSGFLTITYLILYPIENNAWINGVLMLGTWYLILAAYSWVRHQEYSYAKYFALVGSVLLFFSTFYLEEPIYTGLLFFALTVTIVSAGFTYPSYTARMVGLITSGIFTAMYVLSISPMQWMYGYETATAGLGLVGAVFMLTLAQWYRSLPKSTQEKKYLLSIQTACILAAFLMIVSVLINSALDRPYIILLGVVTGYGMSVLGKTWSLPLIRILGIAMVVSFILSLTTLL